MRLHLWITFTVSCFRPLNVDSGYTTPTNSDNNNTNKNINILMNIQSKASGKTERTKLTCTGTLQKVKRVYLWSTSCRVLSKKDELMEVLIKYLEEIMANGIHEWSKKLKFLEQYIYLVCRWWNLFTKSYIAIK